MSPCGTAEGGCATPQSTTDRALMVILWHASQQPGLSMPHGKLHRTPLDGKRLARKGIEDQAILR